MLPWWHLPVICIIMFTTYLNLSTSARTPIEPKTEITTSTLWTSLTQPSRNNNSWETYPTLAACQTLVLMLYMWSVNTLCTREQTPLTSTLCILPPLLILYLHTTRDKESWKETRGGWSNMLLGWRRWLASLVKRIVKKNRLLQLHRHTLSTAKSSTSFPRLQTLGLTIFFAVTFSHKTTSARSLTSTCNDQSCVSFMLWHFLIVCKCSLYSIYVMFLYQNQWNQWCFKKEIRDSYTSCFALSLMTESPWA